MKRLHKKLLSLLLFLILISSSFGANVTKELAGQVASNWPKYVGFASAPREVSKVFRPDWFNIDFAWVIEFSDSGWAIGASDDRLMPIIVYSPTEKFPDEDNPAIQMILNKISNELELIDSFNPTIRSNIQNEREIIWSDVIAGLVPKGRSIQIGPLLSSSWHQQSPFNTQCHTDDAGNCFWEPRCPVGCVATAMAQIMYYWRHPLQGQGENSYTTDTHGWTISANFGNTYYDWANMRDTVTDDSPQAQEDAVAELSFHAGVAVDMDYCQDNDCKSGARSQDVDNALIDHFRFDDDADYQMFSNSSTVIGELNYLRPVFVRGDCMPEEAHAFVCDGYNNSSSPTLFHWNLGWEGFINIWATESNLPDSTDCFYEAHVRYIAPVDVKFVTNAGTSTDGSPSSPYGGLNRAINNAPSGSTLIFQANTNYTNTPYTINKALTLKGVNVVIGE